MQVGAAWLALQALLGASAPADGAAAEAWLLALLRASIERELAEQDSVRAIPARVLQTPVLRRLRA